MSNLPIEEPDRETALLQFCHRYGLSETQFNELQGIVELGRATTAPSIEEPSSPGFYTPMDIAPGEYPAATAPSIEELLLRALKGFSPSELDESIKRSKEFRQARADIQSFITANYIPKPTTKPCTSEEA